MAKKIFTILSNLSQNLQTFTQSLDVLKTASLMCLKKCRDFMETLLKCLEPMLKLCKELQIPKECLIAFLLTFAAVLVTLSLSS